MMAQTVNHLKQINLSQPLQSMLCEDRLVHSINIEGEEGLGKTAAAMALAGAILCRNQQNGRMCGSCSECRKVAAAIHPDIILLDPTLQPDCYKVKNLRITLGSAHLGAVEGNAKIFILARAQVMDPTAQNILLKLIEEPPSDTYFILTCDNRYKLLKTVLSRVTTVTLRPYSQQDCVEMLRERVPGKKRQEYERASELANGSPGLGEQLLSQPSVMKRYEAALEAIDALAAHSSYRTIAAITPFEKKKEDYEQFLRTVYMLLGSCSVQKRCGLSPVQAAIFSEKLLELIRQTKENAYRPLLSSLFGLMAEN